MNRHCGGRRASLIQRHCSLTNGQIATLEVERRRVVPIQRGELQPSHAHCPSGDAAGEVRARTC